MFETPARPERTHPRDWGTERWGDTYEQLHLTGSGHRLLENPRSTTSFCGGGIVSRRTNAYSEDFGSDLNAAGGYRTPLHGWSLRKLSRGSPSMLLRRTGGPVHALRDGSITAVSVKLGAPLAAGSVRVVVHVNGVATVATAEVPPGESFAAAIFDKDRIPLAPGASVELVASSGADQNRSPIALDAAVELES